MPKLTTPIPQDKIGENFVWRDWFQRLSDRVFGDLATQSSSNVNITGGSITGVDLGVADITVVAPLQTTGGNNPILAIPAATTSVDGYLTATDWTTFNNKQPSGSYATLTGIEALQNKTLDNTNTVTLKNTLFTLQDPTDTTKQVQFTFPGITTGTTRTYQLQNQDGTIPLLSGVQTFTGSNTFSNATISVGSSTATGTMQFAYGATLSGNTKTVNIATGGVSGSTTTVTFGSAFGTTVTAYGSWTFNTPVSVASGGTGSGVAYTVATLPTAGTQGRRAWVTNALAPMFGAAPVGGGAVVIPVFDNGTTWIVG